jgi:hypothetical protein
VANAGKDIVRAADAALDAAKAAKIAGDVTKARKAADAADAAVDATRRGVQGAEATGDAAKVAEAQANYQKTQDAAREAREAAERACFVAGTLILTPTGYQAIETLQVGDRVLAGNPETGEVKECRVLQTFEREVSQVLAVQVGDESITCTAEHPFWVTGKGWVKAGQLAVGDLLMTQNHEVVLVEAIESQTGRVKVYNFEVEDLHTYFVSSVKILVHNTCSDWDDPVQNAVEHIINDHPGRLRELGLQSAQELQDLLDDLYANGRTWTRVDNGTVAYVIPGRGIFIDNPTRPTIIPPRSDYRDYLTRDGFTED